MTYMEAILKNQQAVIKNPHAWLPWNYHEARALLEEGNALQAACIAPG
jgi:hypothetical protein